MILSDILGSSVYDQGGRRVGFVVDARFSMSADPGNGGTTATLQGFIVSPHSKSSTWGYERRQVNAPWPIGAIAAWLHRGSFLLRWEDVALLSDRRLQVREGARHEDASLHGNSGRGPREKGRENGRGAKDGQ
ncbi:PRC-barrel domain-containing protein [Arthrobacter sp. B3I4]|uniref:PRC-barrel domain-containing protein n=1 Tax=Arthrobacter sp. B3I4 TaxID=3042267 RepID=UPI00278BA98E|nr:PRC-barrel domain containing protein [Arthrobacter sp. B3I4]MDQ0756646.1 sporulation protein YlmC with PRC-barrel domain [Arthrobacter sp. B3I4]